MQKHSRHVAAPASAGAIKKWRALIGPTDSIKARGEAPQSLRARFGTDGTRNACHGSDAPDTAAGELSFFFAHSTLGGLSFSTVSPECWGGDPWRCCMRGQTRAPMAKQRHCWLVLRCMASNPARQPANDVQREQQSCRQLSDLKAQHLHILIVLAGRCVQGLNTSLCIIKPHIVRQGQAGAVLAALQQHFLVTALQQFHIDAIDAAGGDASARCESCAAACWYLIYELPTCCASCYPRGGAVHHLHCPAAGPLRCHLVKLISSWPGHGQPWDLICKLHVECGRLPAEFFEVYKGVVPPGEFSSMVAELTSGEPLIFLDFTGCCCCGS